MTSPIVRSKIY